MDLSFPLLLTTRFLFFLLCIKLYYQHELGVLTGARMRLHSFVVLFCLKICCWRWQCLNDTFFRSRLLQKEKPRILNLKESACVVPEVATGLVSKREEGGGGKEKLALSCFITNIIIYKYIRTKRHKTCVCVRRPRRRRGKLWKVILFFFVTFQVLRSVQFFCGDFLRFACNSNYTKTVCVCVCVRYAVNIFLNFKRTWRYLFDNTKTRSRF